MDTSINTVLEPKEKVMWQGIVNRKVLLTFLIIFLGVTFLISGILFSMDIINYTSNDESKQIAGSLLGIGVLIIGLLFSLYFYFANIVKEYAITKKRVLIKSGLIGTDFKSIYFDQMKNVSVDVNIIGKMFNVGTVKIDTGKTQTYSSGKNNRTRTRTVYDSLMFIEKPYEVFKSLQSSLSGRKESLYSGRADRESKK